MNKNAELELKHIQLELENNRTQHLRHFIDQYFCYKRGYIKKTGSPDWEAIVWKEVVSLKAKAITNRKDVVKEHVVPLKRITQELVSLAELGNTSLQEIARCLDELVTFATITKEEDATLRQMKLTSQMPPEYDEHGHELYRNRYARYIKAGIDCCW